MIINNKLLKKNIEYIYILYILFFLKLNFFILDYLAIITIIHNMYVLEKLIN